MISAKRERFAREYTIDLNGTQAAIRAGYAANSAHVTANRLLRDAKVRDAVERQLAQSADRAGWDAQRVLQELADTYLAARTSEPPQLSAANKSLELIGKHLGMFRDVQHDPLSLALVDTLRAAVVGMGGTTSIDVRHRQLPQLPGAAHPVGHTSLQDGRVSPLRSPRQ